LKNEKRAATEIPTLAAKNAARVGQPAGTIEEVYGRVVERLSLGSCGRGTGGMDSSKKY
jgi:hypothetical protein